MLVLYGYHLYNDWKYHVTVKVNLIKCDNNLYNPHSVLLRSCKVNSKYSDNLDRTLILWFKLALSMGAFVTVNTPKVVKTLVCKMQLKKNL